MYAYAYAYAYVIWAKSKNGKGERRSVQAGCRNHDSQVSYMNRHYHQKVSNHAEVKEAKRTAAGSPRLFKNVRGATRPEVGRSVM